MSGIYSTEDIYRMLGTDHLVGREDAWTLMNLTPEALYDGPAGKWTQAGYDHMVSQILPEEPKARSVIVEWAEKATHPLSQKVLRALYTHGWKLEGMGRAGSATFINAKGDALITLSSGAAGRVTSIYLVNGPSISYRKALAFIAGE